MSKQFFNSKEGLNFPELAVSILILGTVLVLIMGIFMGGITGMKKSENNITLANVLENTLDEYSQEILSDFDNPLYAKDQVYRVEEEHIVDKMKFEEKWVAFDEMGSAKNKLKEITVTVYWYEKNLEGVPGIKKKSLSTCINNYLTY